jgi:NADPH:quinone reductase-like Zn-dependent oxidoreductase
VKAALYRTHGGPEVLEFAEVPDPVAGPGELVVRTAAVGLNRLDLLQRSGPAMLPHFQLPHIAGMDFAGTVEAVGPGVDPGRVGTRVVVNPSISCGSCALCARGADHLCAAKTVIGGSINGGYGELVAVPATHALPVPEHIDLVEAAALPTVYSRAWQSLFVSGRLAIGETLLVHAAASGVTIASVQLAKRAGARVIVTARTDAELEFARGHGADVVTMDAARQVVLDGSILVRGGRVAAIGPAEQLRAAHPGVAELDARGCIVVPGLINAHQHTTASPLTRSTTPDDIDSQLAIFGWTVPLHEQVSGDDDEPSTGT